MKLKSLPDLSKARLLVVGDVMLDRYWYGDATRISPEAPVPVVLWQREEERLGGAANVARNCAALGAPTQLLSVTGRDEAGERIAKLLREEFGIEPTVISGPATDNQVGIDIIRDRSSVTAVNAMTHSAELGDLLQQSIGLGNRLAKATA